MLWQGSAGVTAGLGEGAEACQRARDASPRLPLAKGCHCDGCHSVGWQTTTSLGAVSFLLHKKAPNLPTCSTCFAPPCCKSSLEEEVGQLLLCLPEWDNLSMSHLQQDVDPVSLETAPS